MPKRIVDGDALWTSEKLLSVPEQYRGEFAWILPLAQSNGCFQCTPSFIWREAYAILRPGWTPDEVGAMLDSFEQAKILFRFQRDAKTYGIFVGIEKEGRLPKPSDRIRSAKPWQTGMVPAEELAEFLGVSVKRIRSEYRDLLAETPMVLSDVSAETPPAGIGVGDGTGNGHGKGIGEGTVQYSSPSLPIERRKETSTSLLDNDGEKTRTTCRPGSSEAPAEPRETPFMAWATPRTQIARSEDFALTCSTPEEFALLWERLMASNPHSVKAKWPKDHLKVWAIDFDQLLKRDPTFSAETAHILLATSQSKRQQKYYVRPAKVLERANELEEDYAHLSKNPKAWGAVWRDYISKVTSGPFEPLDELAFTLEDATPTFSLEDDEEELV